MKRPTTALVAQAWLEGVGLPVAGIGTSLPADWLQNDSIAASGFVQVTAVSGTQDPEVPLRNSTVQVDVWFYRKNQGHPPWGRANELAEQICTATEAPGRVVTLPNGFQSVRVNGVSVSNEPRPMQDEANVARYTVDLIIDWRRSGS